MRAIFIFSLLLICQVAVSQNYMVLHADKGADTINKNIYGHFSEHLGRCIYGGLYVGENNKTIPNKDGIRLDVMNALKKLKVPVLRWPGGCFAVSYTHLDVYKRQKLGWDFVDLI